MILSLPIKNILTTVQSSILPFQSGGASRCSQLEHSIELYTLIYATTTNDPTDIKEKNSSISTTAIDLVVHPIPQILSDFFLKNIPTEKNSNHGSYIVAYCTIKKITASVMTSVVSK